MPKSKASGLNSVNYGEYTAPIVQYITERNSDAKQRHLYDLIFPVKKSNLWAAGYGGQTSLGEFVPGVENGNYPISQDQDDYTKKIENNITWKLKTEVTKEMMDDGQFEEAKSKVGKLVDSFWRTRENFCATFLQNAISTTMTFNGKTFDISGADTLAMFSTAHTSITGGTATQSNQYNMEFTEDNLAIAEAIIASQKGANGEIYGYQADTIIVPFGDQASALQLQNIFQVLNSDGSANSTDRKGQYNAGRFNVISWKFLGNPTGMTAGKSWWILADMRAIMEEMTYVLQNREEANYSNYYDDDTDAIVFKGRARMNVSAVGWRGILACIPGVGTALS